MVSCAVSERSALAHTLDSCLQILHSSMSVSRPMRPFFAVPAFLCVLGRDGACLPVRRPPRRLTPRVTPADPCSRSLPPRRAAAAAGAWSRGAHPCRGRCQILDFSAGYLLRVTAVGYRGLEHQCSEGLRTGRRCIPCMPRYSGWGQLAQIVMLCWIEVSHMPCQERGLIMRLKWLRRNS